MVPPQGDWHRFADEEEKLAYLRRNRLLPKTKDKPIYYNDPRSVVPVVCDVLGYVNEYILVISVNGALHCIHQDLLVEMQSQNVEYGGTGIKYIKNPKTSPLDFVVFDFETTDRNSKTAQIAEIGAVKYLSGRQADTFQTLVRYEGQMSIFAQTVNNISDDMVADAPDIQQALPRFLRFIGDLPLIAHNGASFDFHILERTCNELDMPIRADGYDSCQVAKKRLSGPDNYTLESLCTYYGLGGEIHRALDDALATAEIWKRCFPDTFPGVSGAPQATGPAPAESPARWEMTRSLHSAMVRALTITDQNYDTSHVKALHREQKGSQTEAVTVLGITAFTLRNEKASFAYSTRRFLPAFNAVGISPQVLSSGTVKVPTEQLLTWLESTALAAELYEICLSTSDPFGCCSEYMACSDAKKCVRKDAMFFGRCQYRQHLRNGRIFYGKNRNI